MINIRRSEDRGHLNFGWLDTKHTFSFGEYHDPKFMGFANLRVINEDIVAPGQGFPQHGHRDMEIITVVLEGSLEHKDSLGNGEKIVPGEVQRMSAGKGILHSEFNASPTEPVHLLQIWILPEKHGIQASYEQKKFAYDDKKIRLLVSKEGRDGSLSMNQDVDLYRVKLNANEKIDFTPYQGKSTWVQVARGAVSLNGQDLKQGDAASTNNENNLEFLTEEGSELLVFDLKE